MNHTVVRTLIVVFVLALSACSPATSSTGGAATQSAGGSGARPFAATPPAQRNGQPAAMPAMSIDAAKQYNATIHTVQGDIVVKLRADKAPQTVNNFVTLSRQGYYDSLTFHRVENQPGFQLIQGGDPLGTGAGGPGYTVPAEIGLPHTAGAIAMARKGDQVNPTKASSGSQFYICLVPIPQLDAGYTVFGEVTSGQDVAKQIKRGDQIQKIDISEQ